jgi:hypothetical protein
VVAVVEHYSAWLATSTIPKLWINAEPGALLTGRARDLCRQWPNQHGGGGILATLALVPLAGAQSAGRSDCNVPTGVVELPNKNSV